MNLLVHGSTIETSPPPSINNLYYSDASISDSEVRQRAIKKEKNSAVSLRFKKEKISILILFLYSSLSLIFIQTI